jgi:branched-chain amino acid transport system substrate-binding protein
MKKLTLVLAAVLAIALGGWVWLHQRREVVPGHTAETTLSALLPLSGDLAFLGQPGRVALEIASQAIKDRHIPLSFEIHDTKADPKEAVTILRREIDVRKRNLFLVTLSGPSLAARETLQNTDSLMISVAIHPGIPSTNAPVIRFCASAAQEAEMLARRFTTSSTPVALVVSRDAATTYQVNNVLLPLLAKTGATIAFTEWFDVGNKDFKNLTARLTPQAEVEIILLGYGSDFPGALEAIKQARGDRPTKIWGGIGFVEMAGKPDGMQNIEISAVVPAFYVDNSLLGSQDFRAEYKSRTGKPAPYDAAYTYDATITLAGLLEAGLSTPGQLLSALRGSTITGVTGRISFGMDGEATTDLRWASLSSDGLSPLR